MSEMWMQVSGLREEAQQYAKQLESLPLLQSAHNTEMQSLRQELSSRTSEVALLKESARHAEIGAQTALDEARQLEGQILASRQHAASFEAVQREVGTLNTLLVEREGQIALLQAQVALSRAGAIFGRFHAAVPRRGCLSSCRIWRRLHLVHYVCRAYYK